MICLGLTQTLLKHHLEKLCDCKEICMTQKQRYFLAGADSDPISPSTSEKQLKRKKNAESGKKSNGARKKLKKQKNRLDLKSKEQIIVVCQEQDQVVRPLDQVTGEQENHEAQLLEIEDETYEEGNSLTDVYINKDREAGRVCANATEEVPSENILVIKHEDAAGNENSSVEQPNDIEHIEICGTKKRKRTQHMESRRRRSKRIKKIGETHQDDEVIGGESHDVKQIVAVNTSDMRIQEESHPDNYCYINIEQIQVKKYPELLQIEDSNSDPVSLKSGQRRWTRSQIKTMSEKDALASTNLTESPRYARMSKDQLDVVEYLSEEKPQAMETIEWKEETKETKSVASTKMNGQRAKLRSSLKKTEPLEIQMESVKKPLVCTELSPQLPELVQESTDQAEEDKPKYKGRGWPAKIGKKSAKNCKVESRSHKPKRVKGEIFGKSKTTNEKYQPKLERHCMHKMARRSGTKKRNTSG